MVRLSLVTALMIIVGSTLHLLMPYWKKFVLQMIGVLAREIYIISNPFVYIYVMADLRKHYIAHLRQCLRYLRPTREVSGDVEHRAEVATTVAATTEAATIAPATVATTTFAPATVEAADTINEATINSHN